MQQTPSFHRIKRRTRKQKFYRNCWCPEYNQCLEKAATKDLLIDCSQCAYKDTIIEDAGLRIAGNIHPNPPAE